jgi:hypothetical protein
MDRREFLKLGPVAIGAPAVLVGAPKLISTMRAEVLRYDRWVPVGSYGNLKEGDVWRARYPEDHLELYDKSKLADHDKWEPEADDPPYEMWRVLEEPTIVDTKNGHKTHSVNVRRWAEGAREHYSKIDWSQIPGLEHVFVATMPEKFPEPFDRFVTMGHVDGLPATGVPLVVAHFEEYPMYIPGYDIERKMLHLVRDVKLDLKWPMFLTASSVIAYNWKLDERPHDQLPQARIGAHRLLGEDRPTIVPTDAVRVWTRA